jgi:putative ABC transport system substrate-binding protein
VTFSSLLLLPKRLGLLHEMVPQASLIGVLLKRDGFGAEIQFTEANEAAHGLGLDLHTQRVSSENDFEDAFSAFEQVRAGALLVGADPFFFNQREALITQAAQHRLPAIYTRREFAEAGGLMSYGTTLAASFYQLGVYAGKILAGAKPADLPVLQTAKFEFLINLKTSKALGLDAPATLLARADEVIE